MAKLKAPLQSFGATGTVGQAVTVSKHKRHHVAKKVPTHPDARTDAQVYRRELYSEAVAWWRSLTTEEREALRHQAMLAGLPIYQLFMRLALSTVLDHHERHEEGGADEVQLTVGMLPAHATEHEAGGSDPVDITPGEGHITIMPYAYHSIGQGTWFPWLSALQVLQGGIRNSDPNDGDNISYRAYLSAGTYSLMLFTNHLPTAGIMDIDFDGDEVASFDLYSDPGQFNSRHVQTDIVLPNSGLTTIRCRADGKNALSTDFFIPIGHISLWRTA